MLVRDGKTRKRPDREQIQQIFQFRHVLIRDRAPVLHRSVDVSDAVSELDESQTYHSIRYLRSCDGLGSLILLCAEKT